MSDKCEWKESLVDGNPEKYVKVGLRFHPCEKFDFNIIEYNLTSGGKMKKCYHCKADIRKPEPAEPLIVESGETFVVYLNGIDYLCEKPEIAKSVHCLTTLMNNASPHLPRYLKSFTGPNPDITELTDEIAKLRPMVVWNLTPKALDKIYGVTKDGIAVLERSFLQHIDTFKICNYTLATCEELSDVN